MWHFVGTNSPCVNSEIRFVWGLGSGFGETNQIYSKPAHQLELWNCWSADGNVIDIYMFHKPWRLKTWAISLLRGHWLKMRSVRFIFWLVWIRALMELSNYAGLIWYHCWPCWLKASGNSLCFVFSVCIVSPQCVFPLIFGTNQSYLYRQKRIN